MRSDAVDIVFTGMDQGFEADHIIPYQRSLNIKEAMRDGVLLAYAMNGQPLPPGRTP